MDAQTTKLVGELEAALPKGSELESAQAGDLGGVIGKVLALVTALKAGDYKAALVAFRDLLTAFIGDGGDVIHFQAKAAAAGFDWKNLLVILGKLLPLILGGL